MPSRQENREIQSDRRTKASRRFERQVAQEIQGHRLAGRGVEAWFESRFAGLPLPSPLLRRRRTDRHRVHDIVDRVHTVVRIRRNVNRWSTGTCRQSPSSRASKIEGGSSGEGTSESSQRSRRRSGFAGRAPELLARWPHRRILPLSLSGRQLRLRSRADDGVSAFRRKSEERRRSSRQASIVEPRVLIHD